MAVINLLIVITEVFARNHILRMKEKLNRQERYHQAVSLYKDGQIGEAEKSYQRLIKASDEVTPYALHNLIHIYFVGNESRKLNDLARKFCSSRAWISLCFPQTREYLAASILNGLIDDSHGLAECLVETGDIRAEFNLLSLCALINHPKLNELDVSDFSQFSDSQLAQLGYRLAGTDYAKKVLNSILAKDIFAESELFQALVYLVTRSCAWSEFDRVTELVMEADRSSTAIINPHLLLSLFDDDQIILRFSRRYLGSRQVEPLNKCTQIAKPHPAQDIRRIVFVCNDLFEHATTRLLGDFIHQSVQVTSLEVFWISDSSVSASYQALLGDRLIQCEHSPDNFVAKVKELAPDLVVDLKGVTKNSFVKYFHLIKEFKRIHWLGYPGLLPEEYIDASLFDDFVLPVSSCGFGKVPYLPTNPNLWRTSIAHSSGSVTRFCCFNEHYKISQRLLEIWVGCLMAIPNSQLSLLEGSEASRLAIVNQIKTINEGALDRVSFCMKVSHNKFLENLADYDLFVDTYPCCAHTVMMDCISVGLPALTLTGDSIHSRVASSINNWIGNEKLNAGGYDEYSVLLRALLAKPSQLRVFGENILLNRDKLLGGTNDAFQKFVGILKENRLLIG